MLDTTNQTDELDTPEPKPESHRHLDVLAGPSPAGEKPASKIARMLGARWTVVGLSVAAIGLYVASYFKPWWGFLLFAPQYPKGLTLTISLTGLTGDVHEIDMLNHYIGMGHLTEAAKLEMQLAAWGVGFVCAVVLALALLPGKRLGTVLLIPGLLFPVGFVADVFYWLHTFGHHLAPEAPIRMKAFTPELFGEGKIGQFRTLASPDVGFWLAASGIALLVVAVVLRRVVCGHCAQAKTCGAVCPSFLVGPGAGVVKSVEKPA